MDTRFSADRKWNQRGSGPAAPSGGTDEMFRLLFERSTDPIWLFDPEAGVFIDCNAAAVELMRAGTKERLLQTTPVDLAPPYQADGRPSAVVANEVTRLVEQHGGWRFEWLGRRMDGTEVPVEVTATPIAAGGRRINVVVSRDITDRKRADAALRASEARFRELFERSADAISIFDPAANVFVDSNPAAVALMRAPGKERLLRASPADLSPERQPDGRLSSEKAAELAQRALAGGSQRFEWVIRRFDGIELPTEVVLTPILSGDRPLLLLVSRDITERVRVEHELRGSQQLLAGIADNIIEGIFRTSPEQELTFVNRAYLRMFGYESLEELRAIPRERLYARAEDRTRLLTLLKRAGAFRDAEVEFVRKDGTRFWGLMSNSAIRDPQTGQLQYHVGSITDITQRKQAEDEIRRLNESLERRVAERTAELSASEACLRTLVEHAPEAIVVFDGETSRFVTVNENACCLYGLSREALTQVTPAEVSPEFQPDGRRSAEAAREMIRRAMEGETPVFEWLHRHSSGHEFLCEVRLVRLPGDGEKLIRASVIDRTERRRREMVQRAIYQISEAVHAAQDLPSLYARIHAIVRELMSARNFYISIYDPVNETLSFDYHVDELTPQPDPIPLNTGLTSYVLRTGKALRVGREMNARKRRVGAAVTFDGYEGISYIESGVPAAIWIGVPLVARGRTIGVMAVQDYHNDAAYGQEEEDILTFVAGQIALAIERKRAEQALRESEAKHRALFEASSQGVMLHDEEKFLEVNQATLRILGYDRAEDIIGRHPSETSPPFQPDGTPSGEAARRHIAECIEKGSARFEWLGRTARGDDVPIEVILTRIPMGGRHLIQAVINDISERKKAEAELLKTLAREKELNRLKSNFVSMVSHEFRTPLGVIQSSAEILGDYFDRLAPGERLDHLESIQKNTRRMAELMEEVLVLSRFEAGRMSFEPAPIDLPSLCRRITDELLSATHRRCPITLSTRDVAHEARADDRLLRPVFTNLITNAVKYSPENSPVEFEVSRDGVEAVFVVRDRGIGIPVEDQPWLFNAFQRGRNVGERPGSGLGLVIVKRCVELHGGRIKVDSAVGHGTTVTVRLPVFG